MTTVPFSDQLACAQRELKMRLQVYPRWVEQGRYTDIHAAHEISAMAAIVETLKPLAEKERLL